MRSYKEELIGLTAYRLTYSTPQPQTCLSLCSSRPHNSKKTMGGGGGVHVLPHVLPQEARGNRIVSLGSAHPPSRLALLLMQGSSFLPTVKPLPSYFVTPISLRLSSLASLHPHRTALHTCCRQICSNQTFGKQPRETIKHQHHYTIDVCANKNFKRSISPSAELRCPHCGRTLTPSQQQTYNG